MSYDVSRDHYELGLRERNEATAIVGFRGMKAAGVLIVWEQLLLLGPCPRITPSPPYYVLGSG